MILLKVTLQQVTKIWFYDFVGLGWIVMSMIRRGAAFKANPGNEGSLPPSFMIVFLGKGGS